MDLLSRIGACLQDLFGMFRYVSFGYSFYVIDHYSESLMTVFVKIYEGKKKRKRLDIFEYFVSRLFLYFRKYAMSEQPDSFLIVRLYNWQNFVICLAI